MRTEALVLPEKRAEELGYHGSGPFTFGGVFPGEWTPGRPLRFATLGFANADEAEAALVKAFDTDVLEWASVTETEGYPERFNHAASDLDVRHAADVADVAEDPESGELDVSKIKTHADADKAAAALGITFADEPKPKLEEKVETIRGMLAGQAVDTTGPQPTTTEPPSAEEVEG